MPGIETGYKPRPSEIEKPESPEVREKELGREVSIWWVRHGSPAPDYSEEFPIIHGAWDELKETARTIFDSVQEGETVVFFGAGPGARHRQSQFLLEHFFYDLVRESGKKIELITPDITDRKERTARMRPSLREVEFGKEFMLRAHEAGMDVVDYWLGTGEYEKGKFEPPEKTKLRVRQLINGLLRYTAEQGKGLKVHWILVSSRNVTVPLAVEVFGKEPKFGLPGGKWYRFDAKPGKIEDIQMTHWRGESRETKIVPVRKVESEAKQ